MLTAPFEVNKRKKTYALNGRTGPLQGAGDSESASVNGETKEVIIYVKG